MGMMRIRQGWYNSFEICDKNIIYNLDEKSGTLKNVSEGEEGKGGNINNYTRIFPIDVPPEIT